MRGLKSLIYGAALLLPLTLISQANAQVTINIGTPPVCSYGYYDYAPYACAPVGFYGPGYFYNGIFLGVGPWYQWGYRHGWGSHRFRSAGGGRYVPHRNTGYRPPSHNNGRPPHHNAGYRPPNGGGKPPQGGGRPSNGGKPPQGGRPSNAGKPPQGGGRPSNGGKPPQNGGNPPNR